MKRIERMAGMTVAMLMVGATFLGFVSSTVAVCPADCDNDGLTDAWEGIYNGPGCLLNVPMWDSSAPPNGISDGLEDYDADGATNIAEELPYNTNPCLADTDGDGLLDGLEIQLAASGMTDFNPVMIDADGDGVGDQNEDPDSDGFTALAEQAAGGTSEWSWDTDYDGCLDSVDVAPLANPSAAVGDMDGDALPDGGAGWTELGFGMFNTAPVGRHGQTGDGDADGFTNFVELGYGMNPSVADADVEPDGMPDAWEIANALIVGINDAGANADADALTNLAEFLQFTNPNVADADPDGDGMATAYENAFGTNAAVWSAGADPDADGLANIVEWTGGAHPTSLTVDFDADWMCDPWEVANGLNRFVDDRNGDPDADGFVNWIEYIHAYNPFAANGDADVDGMADVWEIFWTGGIAMLPVADPDADTFTNLQEFQTTSTPTSPDTDADLPPIPPGFPDGLPDSWELKYSQFNGNLPNVPPPGMDTDGDGRTDWVEYGVGTNPDDALN